MARDKTETRQNILAAAAELARCSGAGNLSLDAVAARAGVSKGGLLYHFPSKSCLMEALVEDYLGRFEAALSREENAARPNGVVAAYIAQFRNERRCDPNPPSGLLAALAEDPNMLDPVRRYERSFLDRIRANATDPDMVTAIFLALHGIRNLELLNVKVVTEQEIAGVVAWCLNLLGDGATDIAPPAEPA